MSEIQQRLLDSKMTEMEQARAWSPRVISKFESLIRSGDDLDLYRVNPLAFARGYGVAEPESIDLFLHAARCGLFDMSWDVLCPQSGMVLDSFGALRTLKTHYVCGLCDVSGETDLDDFIEVTFSVSPKLRHLPFHDPDSALGRRFPLEAALRRRWTAARPADPLSRGSPGAGARPDLPPPRTTTTLRAELGPGALSGVNIQTQAALMLPVSGDPVTTPTPLRVTYDGQHFLPALPAVPPGPVVIEVENAGPTRGALLLINWPPEIVAQTVKPTLDFEPYVSGGTLLARQTFRRLFRSERVDEKRGSWHPASDLFVHGPQGFDGNVRTPW